MVLDWQLLLSFLLLCRRKDFQCCCNRTPVTYEIFSTAKLRSFAVPRCFKQLIVKTDATFELQQLMPLSEQCLWKVKKMPLCEGLNLFIHFKNFASSFPVPGMSTVTQEIPLNNISSKTVEEKNTHCLYDCKVQLICKERFPFILSIYPF